MASEVSRIERGEYVLGVAVVLSALLLAASLYMGASGLGDAISKVKISAAAPGAEQQTPGQQGAGQEQPSPVQGDWSFVLSDPGAGPIGAKVTVVEFADFQCPYCGVVWGTSQGGAQYDSIRGTATKVKNEYAATGKVRFVFHVMAFLGQESIDAANAALCAREIGGDDGFFAMHDALFENQNGENQGAFSKANLKRIAADAGLGSARMGECIDSGKYDSQVAQSNAQAAAVGVEGTPTFAVNGRFASPEYSSLKATIDAALEDG